MALEVTQLVASDKIKILRTKINDIIGSFDNFTFDIDGHLTFSKNITGSTYISSPYFVSTIAIGTSPFTITSTTKVTNLNADKVDDYDFDQDLRTTQSPTFNTLTLTRVTGSPLIITSTTKVSNLNVDKVDDYDFDQEVKTTSSPTFNVLTLTDLKISNAIKLRSDKTLIYSDADYQLDVRNSTNPQVLNLYNTYTGATNYERAFLRTTAAAGEIGTEKGSGGGTARPLYFYTDGTKRAEIDTIGKVNFNAGSDSDLDIDEVYVSSIGAGYGMLIVKETSNTATAIYRVDDTTLTLISADVIFSITKDNASTINVYFEDNVIKVQNKTAGNNLVIGLAWYGVI